MKRFTLRIEQDCDTENPCEYAGWEFVSFNRRHLAYGCPYDYIDIGPRGQVFPANIGIRRRLATGTAFILSCYEHGSVQWGLQGETWQCQWDTAQVAGIILWKDSPKDLPKTYAERQEWARSFLSEYNSWCNGDCYWYSLEDEEEEYEEYVDSCGGFIGYDYMRDTIREIMAKYPGIYTFTGDAAWIADAL